MTLPTRPSRARSSESRFCCRRPSTTSGTRTRSRWRSLGTQGSEVGIGLAVGGGTIGYPQFAVGYKNDFVVYTVTASNATQVSRFGDYFSVRPIPGSSQLRRRDVRRPAEHRRPTVRRRGLPRRRALRRVRPAGDPPAGLGDRYDGALPAVGRQVRRGFVARAIWSSGHRVRAPAGHFARIVISAFPTTVLP